MMVRPLDRPVRWVPCLGLALLGPLGWALLWAARGHPHLVEVRFTGGVFSVIQELLVRLHGWLPFSLSETLLLGLVGVLIFKLAAGLYWYRCGRRSLQNLVARGGMFSLALAGAVGISFQVLWGLNHARPTLAEIHALDVSPASELELRALVDLLQLDAIEALTASPKGWASGAAVEWGAVDGGHELATAWDAVGLRHPHLVGSGARVRAALSSRMLTWMGLSGIYSPFTGEPHVNSDMPPIAWPFTACHEVAHQRGVAREDEANFIAWLVCRESSEACHRYSGSLLALSYALGAWYREHPESALSGLSELDHRLRSDLESLWGFWAAHRGPLSGLATVSNDLFLKGLGQDQGVRSYGGVVDLLIGWMRRSAE